MTRLSPAFCFIPRLWVGLDGVPPSHPVFLHPQVPQSDAPLRRLRGDTAAIHVLKCFKRFKTWGAAIPPRGEVGRVGSAGCVFLRGARSQRPVREQVGGRGLWSLFLLPLRPSPPSSRRRSPGRAPLLGEDPGWPGAARRRCAPSRDAVARTQPCPSSGNSTAVGDRCSGVLFLLPGQGWDSRTGPPAR